MMSVPPGTEMFQFPGFASCTYVFSTGSLSRGGLPHSDIRGSTIARISPRLFAACHVLHRLLAPRHPPDALLTLITPHIHRPRAGPSRTPEPQPKASSAPSQSTSTHAQPHNVQSGQQIYQPTHTHTETHTPQQPRHHSTAATARAPPQLPIHLSMNMPQHSPQGQRHGNQCREARHPSPVRGSRAADGGDRIRTDDPLLAKQALSH